MVNAVLTSTVLAAQNAWATVQAAALVVCPFPVCAVPLPDARSIVTLSREPAQLADPSILPTPFIPLIPAPAAITRAPRALLLMAASGLVLCAITPPHLALATAVPTPPPSATATPSTPQSPLIPLILALATITRALLALRLMAASGLAPRAITPPPPALAMVAPILPSNAMAVARSIPLTPPPLVLATHITRVLLALLLMAASGLAPRAIIPPPPALVMAVPTLPINAMVVSLLTSQLTRLTLPTRFILPTRHLAATTRAPRALLLTAASGLALCATTPPLLAPASAVPTPPASAQARGRLIGKTECWLQLDKIFVHSFPRNEFISG